MTYLTPPPYQLNLEHVPNYLDIKVQAESIDTYRAIRLWSEIILLMERHNVPKVIIERNIGITLDSAQTYRTITEVAPLVRSEMKFAVVDANADDYSIEFEELVASNRRMALKVFADRDRAHTWLTT